MVDILSEAEFKQWAAGRFAGALDDPPSTAAYFALPTDAGRKLGAAELVIGLFEREAVAVWVKVVGVWPSCENRCLAALARSALGETRDIEDAPVHVFGVDDCDCAVAILAMCLYFFWDVVVAGEKSGLAVYFSHDEWVCAFGGDSARVAEVRAAFDMYGLELKGP
jgi:hypothetical protein